MVIAEVTAGVCGFRTKIVATYDEAAGTVVLEFHTECAAVQRLAADLQCVAVHPIAFTPACQNPVYRAAAPARLHAACVVPVSVIKAVEAAAGLALPRDVAIRLEKA